MKPNKRMEKIESGLTPKQAALVWLEETSKYANLNEYLKALKDTPEELRPVPRLTHQVAEAVREAMKGRDKKEVNAAVRKAERDVLFLIRLHHQVNFHFLTEERVWYGMLAAIMEKYEALTWQSLYQSYIRRTARIASREAAYPVTPEEGEAIASAIKYHVTTWEELPEQEILEEWLRDYLLASGIRELPEGSYDVDEGKCISLVNENNEKEVRDCFKDEAEFERFKNGEDFTKGLAGVTDAEYDKHHDLMVSEFKKLVETGLIKAGKSLYLGCVPVPYLSNVPLIDGRWLDRYVVELAEFGAGLQAKGYQIDYKNDDHLLAWPEIADDDGASITPAESAQIREKVALNFAGYPGRIKKIGSRDYINFKDYSEWEGRLVKGDLATNLCPGFLTASWNQWLDKQGPKGCLGNVPAHPIGCYVTEHDYRVYGDGTHEVLERRASLLDRASFIDSSLERETAIWKEMTGAVLRHLYTFHLALNTIKQSYYKGEEVLFPDFSRSLADLIKFAEEQTAEFNHEFAEKTELRLDIESNKREAGKKAISEVVNFIDFAKADALDELGEERAASELMEKHIMP